jgi:hypothetical protein
VETTCARPTLLPNNIINGGEGDVALSNKTARRLGRNASTTWQLGEILSS